MGGRNPYITPIYDSSFQFRDLSEYMDHAESLRFCLGSRRGHLLLDVHVGDLCDAVFVPATFLGSR